MPGSTGFSVTIGAVDQASARLDAINKRIAALNAPAERFNKSVAKFGDVTGINKLSEGFLSLGNNALGAFRAVERMAGPMATITGATSLAGITALEKHWSSAGNMISKTAYALNMPVPRLSRLENAFQLAGSSASAADNTMKGLSDTIHDAFYGRDAGAQSTLRALHIDWQDEKGNIADTRHALGQLSDWMEQHTDPHQRMRALTAVHGDPDALIALKNGNRGLEEFERKAERTGATLTEQMASNTSKINQDFERLELNLKGIGNRMANDWSGVTDRVLSTTSRWIEKNQDLAEAIGDVGTAISALSLLKPAAWILRLLGLGAAVPEAAAAGVTAALTAGTAATYEAGQQGQDATKAAAAAGFTEPVLGGGQEGVQQLYRNPKTGEIKSLLDFVPRSDKPGGEGLLGRLYRRYWLGQPDPITPEESASTGGAPPPQPIANLAMTAAKRAFLATLGQPESGGRYDVKNGGARFAGYDKFPEGVGPGGTSSAAGRYQFISKTWHEEQDRLGLKDFSPENQDRAAWDLAWRTYGAATGRDLEADLKAGGHTKDITTALRDVWPSLPGGSQQQETQPQFDALLARNQASGQVKVEVTIANAPPGTRATASSSGIAMAAAPRVETSMLHQ